MAQGQRTSGLAATQSVTRNGRAQQPVAYEELMGPEEDWRSLRNSAERRKIQNRIAQRAYRRSMRQKISEVELLKKQLQEYQDGYGNSASNSQGESASEQQAKDPVETDKLEAGVWDTAQDQEGHRSKSPHDINSEFDHGDDGTRSIITNSMNTPTTRNPRAKNSTTYAAGLPLTPTSPWSNPQQPDSHDCIQIPDLPVYPTSDELFLANPDPPSSSDDGLHHAMTDMVYTDDDFNFDARSPQCARRISVARAPLLHLAIAGCHVKTLKVLLQDAEIAINGKDGAGYTPLQRAVMLGHTEIVSLLLEHGADVNCDEL